MASTFVVRNVAIHGVGQELRIVGSSVCRVTNCDASGNRLRNCRFRPFPVTPVGNDHDPFPVLRCAVVPCVQQPRVHLVAEPLQLVRCLGEVVPVPEKQATDILDDGDLRPEPRDSIKENRKPVAGLMLPATQAPCSHAYININAKINSTLAKAPMSSGKLKGWVSTARRPSANPACQIRHQRKPA